MNGPLNFAARLLARSGALVDTSAKTIEVLLPQDLAEKLDLENEHVVLSESPIPHAIHVGYGSALLDRMVAATAAQVPFVTAKVITPPTKPSQARAAAEAFVFRNGIFSTGEPVLTTGLRLLAHAAFVFHGDERREGISSAAISFHTLGIVDRFNDAVAGTLEETAISIPLESEANIIRRATQASLAACSSCASETVQSFREGMQRRFERDQERLRSYFADLLAELDKRAVRAKGNFADIQEKKAVILREQTAKLDALSARYVIKVEQKPVAFILIEAPVYRIAIELRRRKMARTVELEYDCVTRRLVALTCEKCGFPTPNPAACDEAVHLLCEKCAPKSEGRITCPVCCKSARMHS
jgi:hypothetical protein